MHPDDPGLEQLHLSSALSNSARVAGSSCTAAREIPAGEVSKVALLDIELDRVGELAVNVGVEFVIAGRIRLVVRESEIDAIWIYDALKGSWCE